LVTRASAALLGSLTLAATCGGLFWSKSFIRSQRASALRLIVQPDRILADGYDSALLSIESTAAKAPAISFVENPHGAAVDEVTKNNGKWQARIRAGVLPGKIRLRVEIPGQPTAATELVSILNARDSAEDGTPDFLRLENQHDQQVFRRWFTFLAEAQYFQSAAGRPAEIIDCAALIRYAYREALHAHDSAWADSAGLPIVPAFDSIAKYEYPYTPLGAALYRVRLGPFRPADLTDGAFLQFADAQTLRRFNTYFVTRDLSWALPGDLLFFRQETDHITFHSMIYLGESQFQKDGRRYVLYHTGPTGSDPGQIRRLTVEELMQFPQIEWRPLVSNPGFLGVSRWNILRRRADEPELALR
jgi:uncharacterized protein